MKKCAVITGVLILLAAVAFTWCYAARRAELALMPYWTGEYPDWAPEGIEEPPISEQIEAQIESIETGQDVPLPIPLYITGERIDRLELDWLREKLKSLGYEEKTVEKEGFSSIVIEYAYAHPDYQEMMYLSFIEFDSDTGITSFLVFSKFGEDFSYEPFLEFSAEVAGEKTGSFFGLLHLGIPLSKANEELESVPHITFDWGETDILKSLLETKFSIWPSLFQGTMKEPFAGRYLHRENYTYSLKFTRGKLIEISVMRIDSGTEVAWLKTLSDEQIQESITSMFDEEK